MRSDVVIGEKSLLTDYTYQSDIDTQTYNSVKLARPNEDTGMSDVVIAQDSGMQWDGLVGLDFGYVAAETRRRMEEALSMDDRVTGITDYAYIFRNNSLAIQVAVGTVYGEIKQTVEVMLQ